MPSDIEISIGDSFLPQLNIDPETSQTTMLFLKLFNSLVHLRITYHYASNNASAEYKSFEIYFLHTSYGNNYFALTLTSPFSRLYFH
jgi:hypothetical protein